MPHRESAPEPDPAPRIAAVILAAGSSRRLGEPKQLLRLGGESLLRRTARLAVELNCDPVLVVLGYAADQMCPELDSLPVRTVLNKDWEEGMGSSLRAGVTALLQCEEKADHLMVLLCDQPRLTADHLRRLLALHLSSDTGITASFYAGRSGVPAIFHPDLFPRLQAVRGDHGARDVIREQAAATRTIEWPEGALDIDSPEHLEELGRH